MVETVVGISFRPTKNDNIKAKSAVKLVHDKNNKYSSRAIAVQYEEVILGYIGEKGNVRHEKIFDVLPLEAKIVTISKLLPGETFAKFKEGEITHLEVEFPMATDSEGTEKSFNENISLKYLDAEHRYVYEGKELVSATKHIKRWIEEFDDARIANICADKYGCSQDEVLAFWKGGGSVASLFGTAIHNALEHYEKFAPLGEIIQNQKKSPHNTALPTHPILRKIVEEFYEQKLQPGKVVVEALLTNAERGLCGRTDRLLITGEKTCRVQDYKVNINADMEDKNIKFLGQMAPLPKTKLSKYQLQMSFYARLLELSGWRVEGLDAFVYEGNWRHYKMGVLKLDF